MTYRPGLLWKCSFSIDHVAALERAGDRRLQRRLLRQRPQAEHVEELLLQLRPLRLPLGFCLRTVHEPLAEALRLGGEVLVDRLVALGGVGGRVGGGGHGDEEEGEHPAGPRRARTSVMGWPGGGNGFPWPQAARGERAEELVGNVLLWRGFEPAPGKPSRSLVMDLTPDQEAEAQRIIELLKDKADAEWRAMARSLAGRDTGELFGRTELDIRDRVHRIRAQAIESARPAGRKKRGTSPRWPSPAPGRRRGGPGVSWPVVPPARARGRPGGAGPAGSTRSAQAGRRTCTSGTDR